MVLVRILSASAIACFALIDNLRVRLSVRGWLSFTARQFVAGCPVACARASRWPFGNSLVRTSVCGWLTLRDFALWPVGSQTQQLGVHRAP